MKIKWNLIIFYLFFIGCFNVHADEKTSEVINDREKVVTFVNRAKDYIKLHGKEQAFAEFNKKSGKFSKNLSYIAAVDYNGTFLASINYPDLVGTNQINFKDPEGVLVVQEEIATAKSGGGWIKGRFRKNPQTGKYECKELYILPIADEYLLASGYYYTEDEQGKCS